MEKVRIYGDDMTPLAVVGDAVSLSYTECFREPGVLSLTVKGGTFAAERLMPDCIVEVGEGRYFLIDSREVCFDGGTVTVGGRGLLSLFGRCATAEEYTVDGSAVAILAALARRAASLMPLPLTVGEVPEGEAVHFAAGRGELLSDMVALCRGGGCGMRLGAEGGGLVFQPLLPVDRGVGSASPVLLSEEMGTVRAERYLFDLSSYRNAAVVSGASDGRGGRYSVTVYRDEVEVGDSFPDGQFTERQVSVAFTSPTSAYTVTTAAGTEEFDYASYLAAMRAAGAAALARHRPVRRLYATVTAREDVSPGDMVTLRAGGLCGSALVEELSVSEAEGRRRVEAVLVAEDVLET